MHESVETGGNMRFVYNRSSGIDMGATPRQIRLRRESIAREKMKKFFKITGIICLVLLLVIWAYNGFPIDFQGFKFRN